MNVARHQAIKSLEQLEQVHPEGIQDGENRPLVLGN